MYVYMCICFFFCFFLQKDRDCLCECVCVCVCVCVFGVQLCKGVRDGGWCCKKKTNTCTINGIQILFHSMPKKQKQYGKTKTKKKTKNDKHKVFELFCVYL